MLASSTKTTDKTEEKEKPECILGNVFYKGETDFPFSLLLRKNKNGRFAVAFF